MVLIMHVIYNRLMLEAQPLGREVCVISATTICILLCFSIALVSTPAAVSMNSSKFDALNIATLLSQWRREA